MRKPIRKMVEKYYKKSGIKIPVEVKFSRIKIPAKLRTQYNPKTKQILKNIIQIDDSHYKEFAKVDLKKAKVYLQRSVAHELGHLQRVQDDWETVRRNNIRGISDKKEENYAENYAKKLTGISHRRYIQTLAELQTEYNNRNRSLNKQPKRTPTEQKKFTKEEIKKWAKRLDSRF